MSVAMKVDDSSLNALRKHLEKMGLAIKAGSPKVEAIVAYTSDYALVVHESIEMVLKGQKRRGPGSKGNYWDPAGKGQAKYLESASRDLNNSGELGRLAVEGYKKGMSLSNIVLMLGLRVQRESQDRVPVDFGFLKNSAKTILVKK